MGIKDLLKFMKPYTEPIHIKKYSGKRVGIDAYSWLHKGAYSCSMELCLNSDNENKLRYIDYFMHRINLLRHHKIVPVVVFDGGDIPCKSDTEQDRHRKKTTNHDLAMTKLKEGNVDAATGFFQRAVSVTPSMAHQLIQVLRSENIEYVVAPYEADAQLAHLSNLDAEKGGISAVITEDSDLIAYGCNAIVFKMDRYGKGEEILLQKVFDSTDRKPSFRNFDQELFTGMCVLAGCDFLPSVPGIGIAKSHALVSKYLNLDRVLSVLKLTKRDQVPEDYATSFTQAVSVFRYAQIYDAATKELKHMRPLPEPLLQSLNGELDFLGPEIPPSLAIAIAEGNLDPVSMEAFDISPSYRYHSKPLRIETSGRVPRIEAPLPAAKESCFVVFSSRKAREEVCAVTGPRSPPEEEETCIIDRVEDLEKLIVEITDIEADQSTSVTTHIPLKIPNNNPFKRRKPDQTQSTQTVTQGEEEDALDSSLVEEGGLAVIKFEEFTYHQTETAVEEIPWSTNKEESESEVLNVGFESQESVNSKPNSKITSGAKRKGRSGKIKNSDSKSLGTKNSSILNYFSSV